MSIGLILRKLSFRVRRVAWRLRTAMSDGSHVHSFRLPGGARFDYPLASAIGEDLYSGWFEPAEVAFVRGHLKPGDVVLDLAPMPASTPCWRHRPSARAAMSMRSSRVCGHSSCSITTSPSTA